MWSRTWVSRAWACFLASPVAPPAKAVACARRPAGVTVATSGEIPRPPTPTLKPVSQDRQGRLASSGNCHHGHFFGPRTSFYNLYFAVLVPEEASAGEAKDARLPEPLLGHPVQDLGHLALPDHGVPRAGNPEHQLVRARDDFVERRNREVEQVAQVRRRVRRTVQVSVHDEYGHRPAENAVERHGGRVPAPPEGVADPHHSLRLPGLRRSPLTADRIVLHDRAPHHVDHAVLPLLRAVLLVVPRTFEGG